MDVIIRPFQTTDWASVRTIYEQGLLTGNATFETEIPDLNTWLKKFVPNLLWVATWNNQVVGWAGLQPVSARRAYDGVVEVTIYIHKDFSGKKIGSALMEHLIQESENVAIWTLYSSIFQENTASIRLHLKYGFREIGYREKIAKLNGQWRSTVLFEKRSKIVGN